MGKRKLVPTALHSELTEYSSLIRVLRANNTLDVTAHLVQPGVHNASNLDRDVLESDVDVFDDEEIIRESSISRDMSLVERPANSDDDALTNGGQTPYSTFDESRDVSPQNARSSFPIDNLPSSGNYKRKARSFSPPNQRKRDHWTRWPLLVNDVHVPEWNFEDEIGQLASTALKLNPLPPLPFSGPENWSEAPDDDIHALVDIDNDSSYLPHLTNLASNYLSTILAILAAHTPNRPPSLQNRVQPMGWRNVLDVLASCSNSTVTDATIISSVELRMEAMYGAFDDSSKRGSGSVSALHRIKAGLMAKNKLRAQFLHPSEALLSFPYPPSTESSSDQASVLRRSTRKTNLLRSKKRLR